MEDGKVALQRAARLFSEIKDVDAAAEAAGLLHQLHEKGSVPKVSAPRFLGDDSPASSPLAPARSSKPTSSMPQPIQSLKSTASTANGDHDDSTDDHVIFLISQLTLNRCNMSCALIEEAGMDNMSILSALSRVMVYEEQWPIFVHAAMSVAADAADSCHDMLDDDAPSRILWAVALEMPQAREFFNKVQFLSLFFSREGKRGNIDIPFRLIVSFSKTKVGV